MTTRRSFVRRLAAMPLFGGLAAVLSGCGSHAPGEGPPQTAEQRNDMLKGSADYMREQYAKRKK